MYCVHKPFHGEYKQFTGDNIKDVRDFLNDYKVLTSSPGTGETTTLYLDLEGKFTIVRAGDFIIKTNHKVYIYSESQFKENFIRLSSESDDSRILKDRFYKEATEYVASIADSLGIID